MNISALFTQELKLIQPRESSLLKYVAKFLLKLYFWIKEEKQASLVAIDKLIKHKSVNYIFKKSVNYMASYILIYTRGFCRVKYAN